MKRGHGEVLVEKAPRRSTMGNFSSTCTRSRSADSGEAANASVTCEIGPSSEDVVGESSGYNAIVEKSVMVTLLRGHLLSHFGKSPVGREGTNVEKQISRRIFDIVKLLIENEFYNSIDILITADVADNELQDDPAYESPTKENK